MALNPAAIPLRASIAVAFQLPGRAPDTWILTSEREAAALESRVAAAGGTSRRLSDSDALALKRARIAEAMRPRA